jgi:hypothetical protein
MSELLDDIAVFLPTFSPGLALRTPGACMGSATPSLHDTFLGQLVRQKSVELYTKALPGALVADLDDPIPSEDVSLFGHKQEPLPRVQRLFTMPLDHLGSLWSAAARRLRERIRESDRS